MSYVTANSSHDGQQESERLISWCVEMGLTVGSFATGAAAYVERENNREAIEEDEPLVPVTYIPYDL
jgi:hypothetical protein